MGWMDDFLNQPTISQLLGYASAPLDGGMPAAGPTLQGAGAANAAGMGALQGALGGAPAPAPPQTSPTEPNPVTGGNMPIAQGAGSQPPGMGINPLTGMPFDSGIPGPGQPGAQPSSGFARLVDPTTGAPANLNPLLASRANMPGPGYPGTPTGPTAPVPGPTGPAPKMPPGGAGIVGGGPGSTQVGTGNAVGSAGQFGPAGGAPPGGVAPAGAPQPGGWGKFFGPGGGSNAFFASLGRGLENTAANWNKPAGAAFAAGMGGALTAGSKEATEEQKRAFEQMNEGTRTAIAAAQEGNMAEWRKAQSGMLRGKQALYMEQAKATAEGRPYGAKAGGPNQWMGTPHQLAMTANGQVDRMKEREMTALDKDLKAQDADQETRENARKQLEQKYEGPGGIREKRWSDYGLNRQNVEWEKDRGLPKPYQQGTTDKFHPDTIFIDKDGNPSKTPGPNTVNSVLPHMPKTPAQLQSDVPIGQYYIDPASNQLYTRTGKEPKAPETPAPTPDTGTPTSMNDNDDAAAMYAATAS